MGNVGWGKIFLFCQIVEADRGIGAFLDQILPFAHAQDSQIVFVFPIAELVIVTFSQDTEDIENAQNGPNPEQLILLKEAQCRFNDLFMQKRLVCDDLAGRETELAQFRCVIFQEVAADRFGKANHSKAGLSCPDAGNAVLQCECLRFLSSSGFYTDRIRQLLLYEQRSAAQGRYLLTLVRYFGVLFIVGIAIIPLAIAVAITGQLIVGILAGAIAGAVMLAVLLPVAAVVVDRAEM